MAHPPPSRHRLGTWGDGECLESAAAADDAYPWLIFAAAGRSFDFALSQVKWWCAADASSGRRLNASECGRSKKQKEEEAKPSLKTRRCRMSTARESSFLICLLAWRGTLMMIVPLGTVEQSNSKEKERKRDWLTDSMTKQVDKDEQEQLGHCKHYCEILFIYF